MCVCVHTCFITYVCLCIIFCMCEYMYVSLPLLFLGKPISEEMFTKYFWECWNTLNNTKVYICTSIIQHYTKHFHRVSNFLNFRAISGF